MTAAGSLNTRIVVQRATTGDDGYGNVITGWAYLLTVWANVRETPGKETVAAGRLEASRTATIRIRASSDAKAITPADRVLARGQIWNIRSIAAVDDGRSLLELLCEVGVA